MGVVPFTLVPMFICLFGGQLVYDTLLPQRQFYTLLRYHATFPYVVYALTAIGCFLAFLVHHGLTAKRPTGVMGEPSNWYQVVWPPTLFLLSAPFLLHYATLQDICGLSMVGAPLGCANRAGLFAGGAAVVGALTYPLFALLLLCFSKYLIHSWYYFFVPHPAQEIIDHALARRQPVDHVALGRVVRESEDVLRNPPSVAESGNLEAKADALKRRLHADQHMLDAAIERERALKRRGDNS